MKAQGLLPGGLARDDLVGDQTLQTVGAEAADRLRLRGPESIPPGSGGHSLLTLILHLRSELRSPWPRSLSLGSSGANLVLGRRQIPSRQVTAQLAVPPA